MRAEQVIAAIRNSRDLSLEQGTRLLMAWNAIQNLTFMKKQFDDNVKSMARDALRDAGRAPLSTSITNLENDILDLLELT
jgi:hypothetical protein